MEKYDLHEVIARVPKFTEIDLDSSLENIDEDDLDLFFQNPPSKTYCISEIVAEHQQILLATDFLQATPPHPQKERILLHEKRDYTLQKAELVLRNTKSVLTPLDSLPWQITLIDLLAAILHFQRAPSITEEHQCFLNAFSCDSFKICHGFGLYVYGNSYKFDIQCQTSAWQDRESKRTLLWQMNFTRDACKHNMQ